MEHETGKGEVMETGEGFGQSLVVTGEAAATCLSPMRRDVTCWLDDGQRERPPENAIRVSARPRR